MSSQFASTFPPDFVWGAATASYQIEGASNEDGRGESVWDRFCATPGKVRNGDNGAVACDFYHRYRDDIALMGELGLDAFRFSIAWPRVLPQGAAPSTSAGLDFYDRLVDELLGNGIAPYATLFHWDTPQVIEDAGGWPVRDTVDAFAEYVAAVAERLGDRVGHWITHNEPWVVSWVGHGWGHHAPGRTSDAEALATAHHLLLSHGRAVEILRELSPQSQVGITLNLDNPYAATDSQEDIAAARWVDGLHNRWFLDALFHGPIRRTWSRRGRRSCPTSTTATSRRSRRRSTSSASTTTPRRSSPPTRTAAGRRSSAAPTSTAPTWAGRSCRRVSRTCSSGCITTTSRPRST